MGKRRVYIASDKAALLLKPRIPLCDWLSRLRAVKKSYEYSKFILNICSIVVTVTIRSYSHKAKREVRRVTCYVLPIDKLENVDLTVGAGSKQKSPEVGGATCFNPGTPDVFSLLEGFHVNISSY